MQDPERFFRKPVHPLQRRYEALRAYFVEHLTPGEVGRLFDYTPHSVEVLASRLRNDQLPPFFRDIPHGRKDRPVAGTLKESVLELRKQNLSVIDISDRLTAEGRPVSYHTAWLILHEAGIGRLPRRSAVERTKITKLHPPVADIGDLVLFPGRTIQCRAPLVFLFAPLLAKMHIDSLVSKARYPGTSMIPAASYIRSLLALKLLFRSRKKDVMPIADDEGFGLFAGLNVLPKTTALSDYSYRIGPEPHRALLRGVVRARNGMGAYPGLSFNLDFHVIRHFGDVKNSALEKDYAVRRSQSVPAVVASFAQELESREMVYTNANILKRDKSDEVLRFVDFWKSVTGKLPDEIVFDAHMTTHEGLAELDRIGIKFITLRERRPAEILRVRSENPDKWEKVMLDIEDRKWRTPKVLVEKVEISGYPGKIRQISALDLGREEPTFILTNDARRGPASLLTRYARRTLIENSLGEQVRFFHVDALSSSVRIKVDLDTVLSVVASGCYRWLAKNLKGFETATARTLWDSFLDRPGSIRLTEKEVVIRVRRFSRAPVLLESAVPRDPTEIPWLGNRKVRVEIL